MRLSREGNIAHHLRTLHRVVSVSFTLFVAYLTTFSVAQYIPFSNTTILNNELDMEEDGHDFI
jgi:hypothetical protein